MSTRRGLTLVEMLAAALLLAMLAAACVPRLQAIPAAGAGARPGFDLLDLARLADLIAADLARPGSPQRPMPLSPTSVAWPDHPERPPARMRWIVAANGGTEHAWIVIECHGLAVARWIPTAPDNLRAGAAP
jgi:prepilin-type N-terminal cleavage/methylation domain-containing protein